MRIAILLLFIGSIAVQASARRSATCSSYLDPHIITFDGKSYGFQYSGDQFILFDNLKDTRVTVGYDKCGMGSCNCAVYIKSDRKVIFADFCQVRDSTLPASQFYTMDTRRGSVGLDALDAVAPCKILPSQVENDHPLWDQVPVIAGRFKCARLQGSGQVTTYIIRTVERNPADGIQVKVQLGNQNLPRIDLKIWDDHYNTTGGLCGRWDGSRTRELYVLDRDGVEDFTQTNIDTFREYWRLHSQYNKVNAVEHEQSKRCPECQVISERSIYCPCDNFDMFDNMVNNYNLPKPNRNSYCTVPWDRCLCLKWRDENCTAPVTPTPFPGTTTPAPIISPGELENCYENCQNAFYNNTVISGLLQQNCFEIPESSLEACAQDSCFNPDRPEHFIEEAINNLIETTIQSILAGETNCTLPHFCGPNACSGNGQCVPNTECFDQNGSLTKSTIIDESCLMTHVCECDYPYGDRDCSIDLSVVPEFELDKKCCDLRNEDCSTINIIGSGFSTVDPLLIKIEYLQNTENGLSVIEEVSQAETISSNNLVFRLKDLHNLILWGNINGRVNSSSEVLLSSQTTARITITYAGINSTTVPFGLINLYDSKCRTCKGGETSFLEDKCEIDGVCYNEWEKDPENVDNACIPGNLGWTFIDPRCNGTYTSWTNWFDLDDPSGDGDIETFSLSSNGYGCLKESVLNDVRVKNSSLSVEEAGQVVHFDDCFGFMCLNREQPDGSVCLDYEIRQCCPNSYWKTTTQSPQTDETTSNLDHAWEEETTEAHLESSISYY